MTNEYVGFNNDKFQDLLDYTAEWPYNDISHPDSWVDKVTSYLDVARAAFLLMEEEVDNNIYHFTLSDGRVGVIGSGKLLYTRYTPNKGCSDVIVAHDYNVATSGSAERAPEILEVLWDRCEGTHIRDAAKALLTSKVMKDHHRGDRNQVELPIQGWEFGILKNWRGTFLAPVKTGVYTSISKIRLEKDGYAWIQRWSIDGAVTEKGEHRLMQGSTLTMMSLEDIIKWGNDHE